jgi:hypothetical protein
MPRTKEPERKLAEFMKQEKRVVKRKVLQVSGVVRDNRGRLVEDKDCGPIEYEGPKVDWSSCPPDIRAMEANRATTLAPCGYDDATVGPFFKEFNLDPQNPHDWRKLLYFLIEARTRKPKRMKWTDGALRELLTRSNMYSDEPKDSVIRQRLMADFQTEYGRMTDAALRKLLSSARKLFPDSAP